MGVAALAGALRHDARIEGGVSLVGQTFLCGTTRDTPAALRCAACAETTVVQKSDIFEGLHELSAPVLRRECCWTLSRAHFLICLTRFSAFRAQLPSADFPLWAISCVRPSLCLQLQTSPASRHHPHLHCHTITQLHQLSHPHISRRACRTSASKSRLPTTEQPSPTTAFPSTVTGYCTTISCGRVQTTAR